MSDYLIRAITREPGIRALVCVATDLVRAAAQLHETSPTVTAALGSALVGGALIGALLKVQQRVALKFEGTGPVEKIIVESDSYGRLHGYAGQPTVDLPFISGQPDIVRLLGRAGLLTVNKDVRLKGVIESVVPLATSDINGDLAYYLNQSEQVPSLVEVGALVTEEGEVISAGGLLLQSMPPHQPQAMELLKDRLQELPPIADLLHDAGKPEAVLALLPSGLSYVEIERRELRFECDCSRERGLKALTMLGREELEVMLASEGEAVVDCHFCHRRYLFDRGDLEKILADLA